MVPDDAAVGGTDVDELDPEGVADEVVGEDRGAVEAGVGPSLAVRVGDVEASDGDGVDFVRGFGDGAFDCLFFVVVEDGGHCGGVVWVVVIMDIYANLSRLKLRCELQ